MLVKRTHGDLAMEFQVGWQNYGKCRARNNRRNCVLHIDAVKHVNGLLWIRGRRWERVCRAELIALSNVGGRIDALGTRDRKSTRLNSSHGYISYAVFCLKKKK